MCVHVCACVCMCVCVRVCVCVWLQATNEALSLHKGLLDPQRIGVLGGSHGGFLAAHLIGQHPDVFKVREGGSELFGIGID